MGIRNLLSLEENDFFVLIGLVISYSIVVALTQIVRLSAEQEHKIKSPPEVQLMTCGG